MRMASNVFVLCTMLLGSCGTYYDPGDPYVRGLRWWDRGQTQRAIEQWEPLVRENDPDAQFRYGWYLLTSVPGKSSDAIELFRKAGDQGQPKALMVLGDLYFQSSDNVTFKVTKAPFPRDSKQALEFYLKGQRSAIYDGEREALKRVIPKVEGELSTEDSTAIRNVVEKWKPTVVGRAPRHLL